MGHTRGVLTAPKLVCLPVGSGKLHRNSFACLEEIIGKYLENPSQYLEVDTIEA